MRRRNRLAGLAAAGAAVALVLGACAADEDGEGGEDASQGFEDCLEDPNECNGGERGSGGEIIWSLDQAPDGYFPWSAAGGSVYTLQATQGILPYFGQFGPDGEYKYNMDILAAEPERIEGDPVQSVWQLNPEAVWEDGSPVHANDVIMTWMMSTPEDEGHCEGCAPRAFEELIGNIEGSDDGRTVTVTYKDGVQAPEWFAEFSAHGIVGGFAPYHTAVEQGFIEGDDPTAWDPAGLGEYFTYLDENPPTFTAGPWMIESFDIDTQVVKVPNPNWWGATETTLDRIVIKFLTEEDTWVPALQNAELNGSSPAGWAPDVIRQLQSMENVRLYIQPGPSWEHLDMNMGNQWLGEDVELRRAIFTAVDSADLAQRIYGDLYPDIAVRGQHVHGTTGEYYVDHLEGTGQGSGDIEAAQGILEAAGYTGFTAEDGPLTLDGEQVGPFRLRSTTAPARVTAQQLIQSYLAEIGVEVNIEPTDDLGGTLVEQDYDIMEFGWSGSPLFTGTGEQYWQSESGSNFGKYANEDVDALIEQERNAASLEESAQLHDQMMELVVNDAYVLPLYDTPVYIFVTDDYVGVRDNTNTSLRGVYETQQWGVAAQ
jgi:peptide/nickel transport system substrate-binding protein